jgi:hypothetical protein
MWGEKELREPVEASRVVEFRVEENDWQLG